MTNVKITCTATDEAIYNGAIWGATDALVSYYCDTIGDGSIYDACIDLGDAITHNDDTSAYEAFLACEVTY